MIELIDRIKVKIKEFECASLLKSLFTKNKNYLQQNIDFCSTVD